MKNTLILTALAGLLGVPAAHAQSSATLIGLRTDHLRHVIDPNGQHGWPGLGYDVPRCRRFGLGRMEDLGSHFQPHFVLESNPMSSADGPFEAVASMHARQGTGGTEQVTFSMPPLPWC